MSNMDMVKIIIKKRPTFVSPLKCSRPDLCGIAQEPERRLVARPHAGDFEKISR